VEALTGADVLLSTESLRHCRRRLGGTYNYDSTSESTAIRPDYDHSTNLRHDQAPALQPK